MLGINKGPSFFFQSSLGLIPAEYESEIRNLKLSLKNSESKNKYLQKACQSHKKHYEAMKNECKELRASNKDILADKENVRSWGLLIIYMIS